jgi:hypothetical protein
MAKSKYTEKLAEAICKAIATSSKSLKTICKENSIHVATVLRWLEEKPSFRDRYARAKEQQADYLAEEIIEIADDDKDDLLGVDDYGNRLENKEFVNRSKLRVDARKWVASKLKPKKYADRVDVTSGGEKLPAPDYSRLSSEDVAALAAMKMKLDGSSDQTAE